MVTGLGQLSLQGLTVGNRLVEVMGKALGVKVDVGHGGEDRFTSESV
jgi:hypothetical protein